MPSDPFEMSKNTGSCGFLSVLVESSFGHRSQAVNSRCRRRCAYRCPAGMNGARSSMSLATLIFVRKRFGVKSGNGSLRDRAWRDPPATTVDFGTSRESRAVEHGGAHASRGGRSRVLR